MARKKLDEEKKIGLYTTLAVHLSIVIVLLLISIRSIADREHTFVLDFTKQEELEAKQKELDFKEDISRELDELIGRPKDIRNATVDAGEALKDDRHKNPSEVYNEARELQKRLDASKRDAIMESQKTEDAVDLEKETKVQEDTPKYVGPSVLTYRLDGRKKVNIPVPAYKGYGGGDVIVRIMVNRKGRVVAAKVIEADSTPDTQLFEFALKSARAATFTVDLSAPETQEGEIVYRFIKQ